MKRRISATLFLMGMALLVLLKQPVLTYCTCSESFFVSECDCEHECPCPQEEPTPCEDCSEKLSLDVDDHFWDAPQLDKAPLLIAKNPELLPEPRSFVVTPYLPLPRPPPPRGEPLFLILGMLRI